MKILPSVLLILFCLFSCAEQKPAQLVPDDYSYWERLTDTELNYPIPGHMDNYRIPYINEIGENVSIKNEGGRIVYDYPEGTIIIKEIYAGPEYQDGDKPTALTVMVKDPDSPLARGGWIWIMKSLDSGKEIINTDGFCVNCHNDANENHPYGQGNPNEDFRDCVFFPYSK
jgi:hypothetical protein